MNQMKIISYKGRLVTDSREVAEMVGKSHSHLMRDIKNYSDILTQSNFGLSDFFVETTYKDSTGRTLPCYYLTRKGCDMVANKMTGEKGVLFTATYVTKFEEMEQQLSQPKFKLPQSFSEALRLLADAEEEKQALSSKIKADEPKVLFAETCMTSTKSLLVREVAKLSSKQGVMIGEKRLFQKLRDWGMMMQHRNEPTQRAMEMNLFEIKKGLYQTPEGARDYVTPKVTVKGQAYIIERLRKEFSQEVV